MEKCGGFPEDISLKVGEDYALWLRTATLTDFAFVNEPLLIYRDEPQTSVRASTPPIWELRANVFNSFISWANNTDYNTNNKEYFSLAKRLFLQARTRKILCSLVESTRVRFKGIAHRI